MDRKKKAEFYILGVSSTRVGCEWQGVHGLGHSLMKVVIEWSDRASMVMMSTSA